MSCSAGWFGLCSVLLHLDHFAVGNGPGRICHDLLSSDEIAAVIAHERAHAAGRHDLLIDGARLLATAYPRVGVFAAAQEHLARLIEIRADDIATAHRNPPSLARALVTMASATANMAALSALAATGGDAMQRLDRLLTPPPPLTRTHTAPSAAGALMPLTLPTPPTAVNKGARHVQGHRLDRQEDQGARRRH